MRIPYFSDTFLPEVNGVTTVLAVMRDRLACAGSRCPDDCPGLWHFRARTSPDCAGSPAFPVPGTRRFGSLFPGAEVSVAPPTVRSRLVHVATEGPIGLFGRAFALRHDLPLFTSFHTDFPRYAAHYLGKHATEPVRGYLRWFHRPALATQTPSGATRRRVATDGVSSSDGLGWCGGFQAIQSLASLGDPPRGDRLRGSSRSCSTSVVWR